MRPPVHIKVHKHSDQHVSVRVKRGQSKFALYWDIHKDEEGIWTLTFLGKQGDEFRGIYTLPEIAVSAIAEWQCQRTPHTGDHLSTREMRERLQKDTAKAAGEKS